MKQLTAILLILGMTLASAAARANDKALTFLLDGVKEICASGIPGPLCVFGEQAFPVLVGGKANAHEPLVAAAQFGKGRVVAFGHNGYLGRGEQDKLDTGRFTLNAVRWAAGAEDQADRKVRVGLYQSQGLKGYLTSKGISAEETALKDLSRFDVLIFDAGRLRGEREVQLVTQYVENGGGLVLGSLGWGWRQLSRGKDLATEHPGNQLLGPMGIVWADGYLDRTTKEGYAVGGAPTLMAHAGVALDSILAQANGKAKLRKEDLTQASAVLTRAIKSLPPGDALLLPKLRDLTRGVAVNAVPTAKRPIESSDAVERLVITLQAQELKGLAPRDVRAHPAAAEFPGAVPEKAPRVYRDLKIDTRQPRWHGTGLYAAPGEKFAVLLPDAAADAGLKVQIGAHKDHIWHHDKWKRFPEVTREYPLKEGLTEAACAFGGAIYIVVPRGCKLGEIAVRIGKAVEAPHFILGQTKLADWRDGIRHLPAPWAELETRKVAITVPSASIRALDDPEALMKTWDAILDGAATLAALPLERESPERYVPDVQISAGYMHSGYPIMTWDDQYKNLANREHLLKGNWGLFHELGHNHQSGDWTFGGTGEVTCNLFSLYILDKVCGVGPGAGRMNAKFRQKLMGKYNFDKPDFNQWKGDPFLALTMYVQLQEEFGWEPFIKTFSGYRALPKGARPRSDEDKRDQWLTRFSQTVGKNLGPFFQAWGVPTSEQARKKIAHLPTWMPKDFPPKNNNAKTQ